MNTERWQPRCSWCGRFGVVDSYTSWGCANPEAPEPFDPTDLCARCAATLYEDLLLRLLTEGLPIAEARPFWQSPLAWSRAKGVARGLWAHGSPRPIRHEQARYAMEGFVRVWYCQCGRPEKHPTHDRQQALRLNVRLCPFKRSIERPIRRGTFQYWCACGWSTGRLAEPRIFNPVEMEQHLASRVARAVA